MTTQEDRELNDAERIIRAWLDAGAPMREPNGYDYTVRDNLKPGSMQRATDDQMWNYLFEAGEPAWPGSDAGATSWRARAEQAERERDELLAWAKEMRCEMQADDEEGFDPRVCSLSHTGRCWPCEAKSRELEGGQ